MRKYNTLAGGGEEEALRLSSSGAEPGINCNNSSSMSEITEGGKGAILTALINVHVNTQTLVNKPALRWTRPTTHGHTTSSIVSSRNKEMRNQSSRGKYSNYKL